MTKNDERSIPMPLWFATEETNYQQDDDDDDDDDGSTRKRLPFGTVAIGETSSPCQRQWIDSSWSR